jgi:hypothetical protein
MTSSHQRDDFLDAPDVISDACFHCWHSSPAVWSSLMPASNFGLSPARLLLYLTRSHMNRVSTTGLLSSAASIFKVIRSGP